MQDDHVDRVEGSSGMVQVSLHNFPIERCPNCGARSFEIATFMTTVVRDFAMRAEIKHAKSKGFFHKTWVCCQCSQELKDSPMPRRFDMKRPLPDGTMLEIEINAPAHNCQSCGTAQLALEGGAGKQIAEAFGNALQAASRSGDGGILRAGA
jgi:Zn finger protein HypA/HybF involved in hydrogenase expression